ncbi:MAG: ferritin-like domain-containing protein, partial [Burkholderiaceae bacterium]
EAAELEHNLLCSYLFAAFSLKQGVDEDLEPHEWQAVERWRAALMQVCVEEMLHLAQVANLTIAVGSRPHFDRPNLPAAPGYHPAGVQVALRRFDLDTLQHFVYLERPEGSAEADGAGYEPPEGAGGRGGEIGRLMPSSPHYETIGEFYRILEQGFVDLAGRYGERVLFLGPAAQQLRADEIGAPELAVVKDLATARRAIHLIVVQGEGSSPGQQASHFGHFNDIAAEYRQLVAARPSFSPSRPVANSPVMRRPHASGRVHVTGAAAAPLLDAANAVYSLMLRCLVELYDSAAGPRRDALLGGAFGLMKALGEIGSALTRLPALDAPGSPHAGITFAMMRSTEGYALGVDPLPLLVQQFADVESHLHDLHLPTGAGERIKAQLAELRERLQDAAGGRAMATRR